MSLQFLLGGSLPPEHPWVAVGWDQSVNHGGLVVLRSDGGPLSLRFLTTSAADGKLPNGTRLPPEFAKTGEKDERVLARLRWLRQWFQTTVESIRRQAVDACGPGVVLYVAVEDYPMGKLNGRVYHIAEAGGHLRTALTDLPCVHMRLHEPKSVKLFAAGSGDADKDTMTQAARTRWGADYSAYTDGVEEDLADAHALAELVRHEVHLRRGTITMAQLPETARTVFNRTTKAYPVNILARPWLRGAP